MNLLKCVIYSISNPQNGVDGGTLYIFCNILPCIISMSSISLFVMFAVDSMLLLAAQPFHIAFSVFYDHVFLLVFYLRLFLFLLPYRTTSTLNFV